MFSDLFAPFLHFAQEATRSTILIEAGSHVSFKFMSM